MATLRIPTPLRPYTQGQSQIDVQAANVAGALAELTRHYPSLKPHLYDEDGDLRAFVNVFLNDEDVRHLDGHDTAIQPEDRLMIIPSIAGGADELRPVDHNALRVNQALIIGLSILAFILNLWPLAALVGLIMFVGSLLKQPGFGAVYQRVFKPLGWVKADVIRDHPEPHRFAQGFGAVVVFGASGAFAGGLAALGWGLVWLVIALAALNLFAGFCVGCAVYYWLARLNVPGFAQHPPAGTLPGMRPKIKAGS
jgi:molybdopterin converting factor small subunit